MESKAARLVREARERDAEHAAWLARPDVKVTKYVRKGHRVKAHKRGPADKAKGWQGIIPD